jgi:aminoglycoside phosphotransferase (APT) family kinase protein
MWLAALHQHRPVLDRQIHLAKELVNLQSWSMLIDRTYGDEAEPAGQLFRYLQGRAEELRFEGHVPIHKDFHYGHLIVNGRLNVIDFDEMRLGDANFDLAHFCAYLTLLIYRKNRSLVSYSDLESAFLGAYAERTGWAPDERFVYFYVYTCLKIAWQLCAGSGPHPRPQGQERRHQLRHILAQGLAAVSNGLAESRSIGVLGYLERSV